MPDSVSPSSPNPAKIETWLRALTDASPALVWFSGPDQLCTWFNRAWLEYTGRKVEEESGNGWAEGVHPDDAPLRQTTYAAAFQARQPFQTDYRLKHHSGEHRWILETAGPVYSPAGEFAGYFGSCIDIHDRKLAAERERVAADHFRTLADATPQRVATARPDGQLDWFNRQWFQTSRCTFEELRGEGWVRKTVHPDEVESTLARWKQAIAEHLPMELEHRLRDSHGEYRWHMTRAVPVRDRQGALTLWLVVNTDVDAITQAREAVRKASVAKDEFIAALSHELRTPLTPVLLLSAEMQSDPQFPQEYRDAISTIRHNAELEARLIDDLLDLTRIVHGRMRIRPENANLHSLLSYTEGVVRSSAKEKKITLSFELGAADSQVRVDAARLQQVAWNLLNNAIKFTPEGGAVTVRTYNPAPGRVSFEVRDNGVGISAEHQQHIFDAFNLGLPAGDHRFGGLGLGLAISKAIMEMHSGSLEVESAGNGQGAAFVVSLDSISKTAGSAHSSPGEPPRARPLRILLVEDHAATLSVLEKLLRRDGHTVTSATTVQAALAAGRAGEFEVLVSDLGLPDGSGCEIIVCLQRSSPIQGIALSGYGMDADIERSQCAGFARHLTKPIDFSQLRQALYELSEQPAEESRESGAPASESAHDAIVSGAGSG